MIVSSLALNQFNMGFKLDLGKYVPKIKKQLKDGINESLEVLEKDIQRFSPVDSGDYIESNQKTQAIEIGDNIKGSVFNDDSKAVEVEYGFRTSPVTWSKKGGSPIVEEGVGARVYTKAYLANETEIKSIIRKKIDLG